MYATIQTLAARNITFNQTAVLHGAHVFCVNRLKGDSFNVTKHTPGSDCILASEQRLTFAELTAYITK